MTGHVEVKGNERAGGLPSIATVVGGRPIYQTDIPNAIRDTALSNLLCGKLDSTSLS